MYDIQTIAREFLSKIWNWAFWFPKRSCQLRNAVTWNWNLVQNYKLLRYKFCLHDICNTVIVGFIFIRFKPCKSLNENQAILYTLRFFSKNSILQNTGILWDFLFNINDSKWVLSVNVWYGVSLAMKRLLT